MIFIKLKILLHLAAPPLRAMNRHHLHTSHNMDMVILGTALTMMVQAQDQASSQAQAKAQEAQAKAQGA